MDFFRSQILTMTVIATAAIEGALVTLFPRYRIFIIWTKYDIIRISISISISLSLSLSLSRCSHYMHMYGIFNSIIYCHVGLQPCYIVDKYSF
jgi:hypothetical protein